MVHFQNERPNFASIHSLLSSSKGVVKYWAMRCLGYSKSALETESKALLAAVQCNIFLGYKKIIFECDCEVQIRSLLTLDGDFSITTICSDIKRWCGQVESFHYRHVHREENAVAHELPKRVTTAQPFTSLSCFVPYWLTPMCFVVLHLSILINVNLWEQQRYKTT